MGVRFFNGVGPEGAEQLLIAMSFDAEPENRGQMREAVRPATDQDIALYAAEYQAYQESFAASEVASDEPGPAAAE